MTRVKICGITNLEDALAAVSYGASALGFIFVRDTPRYVGNNREALRIPEQLPPFVSKVAIYHSAGAAFSAHEDYYGSEDYFDCIQYYSRELDRPIRSDKRSIYALRVSDLASLSYLSRAGEADAILLDAYHPDLLGGSGVMFNWEIALEAKRRTDKPVILAGGLNADNVGEAIAKLRPYAVDVSSGVEAEPGRKDHAKLKAFIKAVQKADAKLK
jgi:phosphoribosylanthranilate isomerase